MHVFEDLLSKEIEKKVRINFRVSYLRDTVLASKIDESLLTTLNTMIYYNNFEIIYYILAEKSKLNLLIETFSLNKLEEKVTKDFLDNSKYSLFTYGSVIYNIDSSNSYSIRTAISNCEYETEEKH